MHDKKQRKIFLQTCLNRQMPTSVFINNCQNNDWFENFAQFIQNLHTLCLENEAGPTPCILKLQDVPSFNWENASDIEHKSIRKKSSCYFDT